MGEKNKILELLNKRAKINKEIDEIQKGCQHLNIHLKSIQERVDSTVTVIRYVCDDCGAVRGIPDPTDLDNYLNE
jgi:hypothetical protein